MRLTDERTSAPVDTAPIHAAVGATERPLSRLLRLGPLAIGFLALAALFSDDEGTILCPFRRCTGGYCPLCGGTRAAANLARGDVGASVTKHPAVVFLALQLPVAVWFLAVGATTPTRRRGLIRLVAVNIIALVALWALRLGLGDIPRPTGVRWPL